MSRAAVGAPSNRETPALSFFLVAIATGVDPRTPTPSEPESSAKIWERCLGTRGSRFMNSRARGFLTNLKPKNHNVEQCDTKKF